jgi:hypothetical protein
VLREVRGVIQERRHMSTGRMNRPDLKSDGFADAERSVCCCHVRLACDEADGRDVLGGVEVPQGIGIRGGGRVECDGVETAVEEDGEVLEEREIEIQGSAVLMNNERVSCGA